MKYYRKQLKRIEVTRKLLKAQHNLLRELLLEGLTQVTFHTTTRSLSLPFDAGTTYEASSAYSQFLSKRIAQLKREAVEVNEQWKRELEIADDKQETPADATAITAEQGTNSAPNLSGN